MEAAECVVYEKTHRINMGNYEFVEVKAGVVLKIPEGEDARDTLEIARQEVDHFIIEDLEKGLESTAEDETYAETWLYGPRRSRRRVNRKG